MYLRIRLNETFAFYLKLVPTYTASVAKGAITVLVRFHARLYIQTLVQEQVMHVKGRAVCTCSWYMYSKAKAVRF